MAFGAQEKSDMRYDGTKAGVWSSNDCDTHLTVGKRGDYGGAVRSNAHITHRVGYCSGPKKVTDARCKDCGVIKFSGGDRVRTANEALNKAKEICSKVVDGVSCSSQSATPLVGHSWIPGVNCKRSMIKLISFMQKYGNIG
jgi:hypothetical protein